MTEHTQAFEAYLHTDAGIDHLDLEDPLNCLILVACRKELQRRGEVVPDKCKYDVFPYMNYGGPIGVIVSQTGEINGQPQALDIGFVFDTDEIDEPPSLVPEDMNKEGEFSIGYWVDEVDLNMAFKFGVLAAARSGSLN